MFGNRVVLLREDGVPEMQCGDDGYDDEELIYSSAYNVVRLMEQGTDVGAGTVHITSRRVVFVKQVTADLA